MELVLVAIILIVGILALYFVFNTKPAVAVELPKATAKNIAVGKKPKEKNEKKSATSKKQHQPQAKENEVHYDDDATKRRVVNREEEITIFKQFQSADAEKEILAPKEKKKTQEQQPKMPSQKQIEKDLERGFTLVTKKGPAPLTAEQKKEREDAKKRAEEDAKRKEQEQQEYLKRQQKRKEKVVAVTAEVSQDQIKTALEQQKKERNAKLLEKSKTAGGAVKEYLPAKTTGTEEPAKQAAMPWVKASVSVGSEGLDAIADADYPRLHEPAPVATE